jgi:hypothetical protein
MVRFREVPSSPLRHGYLFLLLFGEYTWFYNYLVSELVAIPSRLQGIVWEERVEHLCHA